MYLKVLSLPFLMNQLNFTLTVQLPHNSIRARSRIYHNYTRVSWYIEKYFPEKIFWRKKNEKIRILADHSPGDIIPQIFPRSASLRIIINQSRRCVTMFVE